MDILLSVDDRESKIIADIASEFAKPFVFNKTREIGCTINYKVRRLEVADYIISITDCARVAIERKTLKDYAASIKDGRHANKVNLLNLRAATGCKIFYIIEGHANPAFDHEYCGIKYSTILASMQNLQLRDNIHIIRTVDKAQTARELRFLCESVGRLDFANELPVIVGGSKADNIEQDTLVQEMIKSITNSFDENIISPIIIELPLIMLPHALPRLAN